MRPGWILKPDVPAVHSLRFLSAGANIIPTSRDMESPVEILIPWEACGARYVVDQLGESSTSGHSVSQARDIGLSGRYLFSGDSVAMSKETDASRRPNLSTYQKLCILRTRSAKSAFYHATTRDRDSIYNRYARTAARRRLSVDSVDTPPTLIFIYRT